MFGARGSDPQRNRAAVGIMAQLFKALLEKKGVTTYRVEANGMKLHLRESSSASSRLRDNARQTIKTRVESIVSALKNANLFHDYDKTRASMDGPRGSINFYLFQIKGINTSNILEMVTSPTQKPADIELSIWNAIPEPIQIRWKRLSSEMKTYITSSVSPASEDQLASVLSSRLFTDSVRDPIMAAVPKIPVRFKENKPDQFMDLCDVFKIKRKREDGMRHNPFNNAPFVLSELVPAPDLLARIRDQAHAGPS